MRFGIQLPTFGPTAARSAIEECARRCEDLGYDSIWANDHVLVPRRLDPPYGRILECLTTLALAGAITHRVKLGTSILVLPQREPVLTAKQLATLDVLSEGRVICGVGAGYVDDEFEFLGASPRHKGARLESYLGVMRALWSEGEIQCEGEWEKLNDGVFGPRPVHGADLPIWIAGNSERAIQRAARLGDAWHPAGISPAQIEGGIARLRTQDGKRRVRVALKVRAGLTEVCQRPDGQRSPSEVDHPYELLGTVEEVRDELRAFQRLGVDYVVMFMFHSSPQELYQSLALFAGQVMPEFVS